MLPESQQLPKSQFYRSSVMFNDIPALKSDFQKKEIDSKNKLNSAKRKISNNHLSMFSMNRSRRNTEKFLRKQ